MGKSSLGSVLDPSALEASTGPRARLRVDVPAAWLTEGADLEVTTPARLSCARCDGGGCDACARSGALRAPAEAGDRVVRARVPPACIAAGARAIALRIPQPFGPEHAIDQLLLELCAAAAPSAGVARIAAPLAVGTRMPARLPWPVVVMAVVAAILFALFGR